MRAAIYARVSTARQARAQKADQQVERLKAYAKQKGWTLGSDQLYLDEGYSGASLNRLGLDALRDAAAMAEFDVVLITAPDRLARKYVHQVLLIEELQQRGCRVEFVERPMSSDPNDQLLLQIRGAVAEYERTLIAEDAPRETRQTARRTASAVGEGALRLPDRSRPSTRSRRVENRRVRGGDRGADVRLVPGARSDFRQPRKKAHRRRRSHSYR
jgi:DNA invertase Pin-like site-specific DNA recombinase